MRRQVAQGKLAATHAVTAVVTEVTIAVSHGDHPATITAGRVSLEIGKLAFLVAKRTGHFDR